MACNAELVHWDELVPPEGALEQLDPLALAIAGAIALALVFLAIWALRRGSDDRGSR